MDIQTKAKSLRKQQTDAERLLWRQLRDRRFAGYKFRRQVAIGHYIADFVCLKYLLIVEVDGGQHLEQRRYDETRTRYLESQGFRVMRFWNNEVLGNIAGVLDALTLALSRRERGLES
jgi:very-short-patch-repair endonuclease